MAILVTGGLGYIGSHTIIELLEKGLKPNDALNAHNPSVSGSDIVVYDNLSGSNKDVINRINNITGQDIIFVEGDIRDKHKLSEVFKTHNIETVMHFAGLKSAGESVCNPLAYYDNNVCGTVCLLNAMKENNVKRFIFSSSASVYGIKNQPPMTEDMELSTINPYGWTKIHIERILTDLCASDNNWRVVAFRYFNVVGAHESGLHGESPVGAPANIAPYISQTLAGIWDKFHLYGDDYDTPDGTCIRDYIHINDLSRGHILALSYLDNHTGLEVFNLGTGKGSSNKEVIEAFEKSAGKKLNYEITARRPGDPPVSYADVSKAEKFLGFKAAKNLADMCRDLWRWQNIK
ncbi:MAG: UDP-glucose 4-epimerase GalE [Clostridiales bacterium]|nr:UDP-glucose 4-epimerase GalE [Clostridiales bacterium]